MRKNGIGRIMNMAILIFQAVFILTLILSTSTAINGQVVTSCTQVLPQDKCTELTDVAKDLHLATPNVVSGLKDALKQANAPEIDIYTKVKEYLDAIFMCRIFLSAKMCSHIQQFAAEKNVPFYETETHLNANVAMGVKEKKHIYAAIMQFVAMYHKRNKGIVRKDDKVKSCTDILDVKHCKKLEVVVEADGLAKSTILKGLREASMEGTKDGNDIYEKVLKYLEATFLCHMILLPKMCKELQHLAADKGIAFHEVQTALQANVAKGVKKHKDLYSNVMYFIVGSNARDENTNVSQLQDDMNKAAIKSCQDILSNQRCKKLEDAASNVGLMKLGLLDGLKDSTLQGKKGEEQIFETVMEYIDAFSTCTHILTQRLCEKIQHVAARQRFPLHEVVKYLKANTINGITGRKIEDVFHIVQTHVHNGEDHSDEEKQDDGEVQEKQECRKVLSNGLCNELEQLASRVGLPSNEIINGLKDGSLQKATGDHEIYKRVIEYLDAKMLCELVLSIKMCNNLHDAAYTHNIPYHDVDRALQKYYGKGITDKGELYTKLMQYVHDKISHDEISTNAVEKYDANGEHMASTCEDRLNVKLCEQLMAEASKVHLSGEDITKGLIDASIQGVKEKAGIFKEVKEYLQSVADCVKVLNEKMCKDIKHYAVIYRVPFHEVDHLLNKYTSSGMLDKKVLYQRVMKYLSTADDEPREKENNDVQDEKTKECTDFLPAESCKMLTQLDVTHGFTDASIQGMKTDKDINDKVKEYLQSIVECISILNKEYCKRIKESAIKWKVPFHEIDNILRGHSNDGNKDHIYQIVMKYISTADDEVDTNNNNFVAQDENIKTCADVLPQEHCQKLEVDASGEHLEHWYILNGLKDAFVQGATSTKDIYDKAKEYLRSIMECEKALSKEMCEKIRSSAEKAKVPFQEVDKLIQSYVTRGVKDKQELFHKLMTYVATADDEVATSDDKITVRRRKRSIENEDEPTINACKDVLPANLCQKLTQQAKGDHYSESDVVKGLRDAKIQGVKKEEDIYKKAKEYLESLIECAQILNHEYCGAIKHQAEKWKVPFHEVDNILKQYSAHGVQDKHEMYQKVLKYVLTADDELSAQQNDDDKADDSKDNTSCNLLLSEKLCKKLKAFTKVVFVDESEVKFALKDAILQGATQQGDIFNKSKSYLEARSYCDFVLTKKECKDIQKLALNSEVPLRKVCNFLQEKFDMGNHNHVDLVKMTRKYIDDSKQVSNVKAYSESHNKCMQRLKSIMKCLTLKIFAFKEHLKTNAVKMALDEATQLGETTSKGIYNKAVAFLKSKVYCLREMSEELCNKIHAYVIKHKSSLNLLNRIINSNRHKRKPKELYDRVIRYLGSKQGRSYLVIGE